MYGRIYPNYRKASLLILKVVIYDKIKGLVAICSLALISNHSDLLYDTLCRNDDTPQNMK